MNLFRMKAVENVFFSAEDLRSRINPPHYGQQLVQECLQQTRRLAGETRERSILLFFAMTVLGRHPRGTSAVDDFTALFTELGLPKCADAVRKGNYCPADLAFFWSSDKDLTHLFKTSNLKPLETRKTSEHARALPKTIMHDEWGDVEFYEFNVIQDPVPSKSWNRYLLDNATIFYDLTVWTVLDASGHPVVELSSHFYEHTYFTRLFGEQMGLIAADDKATADNEIVLESALMIQDPILPVPNYCHWLLDQLPRTIDLEDSQQLLVHSLAPFIQETLDMIGVDTQRVVELKKDVVVKVERLAMESSLARNWYHPCQHMNAELVRYVRGVLQSNDVSADRKPPYRNIYISRNRSDRRIITNEGELLDCLKRFDFEVVYCEELTLADQIELFKSASVIVAPHGAGLSNVIFCDQSATVVEIFNPNYGTQSFRLLAQLLDIGYQHILGTNPVLSASERQSEGRQQLQKDDIEADIDKVEQCLKKIFGGTEGRAVAL